MSKTDKQEYDLIIDISKGCYDNMLKVQERFPDFDLNHIKSYNHSSFVTAFSSNFSDKGSDTNPHSKLRDDIKKEFVECGMDYVEFLLNTLYSLQWQTYSFTYKSKEYLCKLIFKGNEMWNGYPHTDILQNAINQLNGDVIDEYNPKQKVFTSSDVDEESQNIELIKEGGFNHKYYVIHSY